MSLIDDARVADTCFRDVPIIDLSRLSKSLSDASLRKQLVAEVRDACIRVGFFYVSGHGISEATIENVLSASTQYFSLPYDKKMELSNKLQANFMGYSPLLSGKNDPKRGKDLQEGFEFGYEPLQREGSQSTTQAQDGKGVMAGANVWPSEQDVPGFRNAALSYYHAATSLGHNLFPLFAEALDLPPNFFADKTKKSAALMKLLHYPPQPERETLAQDETRSLGIGAHTDWECFTILWQQPGHQALQVLNSSRQWIDAPPIHGTLVINLGDEFARMTNGIFKSTVHRAINQTGAERYSIPLFFGIDYDVLLEAASPPNVHWNMRSPQRESISRANFMQHIIIDTSYWDNSNLENTSKRPRMSDSARPRTAAGRLYMDDFETKRASLPPTRITNPFTNEQNMSSLT